MYEKDHPPLPQPTPPDERVEAPPMIHPHARGLANRVHVWRPRRFILQFQPTQVHEHERRRKQVGARVGPCRRRSIRYVPRTCLHIDADECVVAIHALTALWQSTHQVRRQVLCVSG